MKKLNYLFACFLSILILSSCSEDLQETISDVDPVVFSGIEVSQNFAFIEDVVSLNINASGYGEIEVTSNSSEIVSVTSVGDGIYEISATEAVNVNIYVKLKDKNGDATGVFKTTNVTFYEHGVVGKVVEGISLDTDKKSKILTLMGEPDDIFVSSDSGLEYLYYLNLGVAFQLSNNIVGSATLYSSNYFRTLEGGVKTYFTDYPYNLPHGWKINQTTMNSVIGELGDPNAKSSTDGSTLRSYRFDDLRSWVRFFSDTEDGYFGKVIKSWSMY